MLPDLERVIELQKLEDFAERARATITEQPQREKAFDDRAAALRANVAAARERVAANQAARRTLEKDVAALQSRLSHFKEQAMAVKTNREYQAIGREIETAQQGIRAIEDQILERMLEAEELAQTLKQVEAESRDAEKALEQERAAFREDVERLKVELEKQTAAREKLVAEISPETYAVFELVAKMRKGIAVAEARDGHCAICHVRLRPQVTNDVRRNDSIIQCDSCRRILYHAG